MTSHRRSLALGIALALAVSACGISLPETEVPEPDGAIAEVTVSTDDLLPRVTRGVQPGSESDVGFFAPDDGIVAMQTDLPGGAYAVGVPEHALIESSDLAFQGVVLNIKPAVLNTPTGGWDPAPASSAELLHGAHANLLPYTAVELRVDRMLGARQSLADAVPDVGDVVTVWLLGGSHTYTVAEADAKAIGLPGDVDPDTEGPDGAESEDDAVTGDLIRTTEMAHAVYFEEGDQLIVFGRWDYVPPAGLDPERLPEYVLFSLLPQGSGLYRIETGTGDVLDLASGRHLDQITIEDFGVALDAATGDSTRYNGS
ncbi:MAG: hypothetical protein ABFR53_13315 [Actinomycetota bacterium]